MGHGIRALGSPLAAVTLKVSQSRVEKVHQAAVHSLGASLKISESILEDVTACGQAADLVAIHAQPDENVPIDPEAGEEPPPGIYATVMSSWLDGAARAGVIGFGNVKLCTHATSRSDLPIKLAAGADGSVYPSSSTVVVDSVGVCNPDASLEALDTAPGIFDRDADGQALPTISGTGTLDKDLAGMEIWMQGRDAIPRIETVQVSKKITGWNHPWIPSQQEVRLSFADPVTHRVVGALVPMKTAAIDYQDGLLKLPTPNFFLEESAIGLGNRPLDHALGIISLIAYDENRVVLGGVTANSVVGKVFYVYEEAGEYGMHDTGPTTADKGTVVIVELPPGLVTIQVEHPDRTCRAVAAGGEVAGQAIANQLTLNVLPMPLVHVDFRCAIP